MDSVRVEIIEAAGKVFFQIHVSNMTLKTVADAVSISKGAFYYYYKSKDDILYDIMEQDNAHTRQIAGELIEKYHNLDVEDLKKDITIGILNRFIQSGKNRLNLYLQGEAPQGNTELQKKYNEKYHERINNTPAIMTASF